MSTKVTCLAMIVLSFGNSVAVGQTLSVRQGNGDGPAFNHSSSVFLVEFLDTGNTHQQETQTPMYEDIEIMRRLLSSKLEKLYPSGARDWRQWSQLLHENDPSRLQNYLDDLYALQARVDNWPNKTVPSNDGNQMFSLPKYVRDPNGKLNWIGVEPAHSLDVEGSYLPGYGIVYTVTLPPPQRKPKTQPTKPQPKPLTDWERMRKQLHGEKEPDQAQQTSAQPKEVSLTDVILKTLFENGQHLVRLNQNDKLTVAITFRPMEQQGLPVTATSSAGDPFGSGTRSITLGNLAGVSSSSGSAAVGDPTTGIATKAPSSARDYLLLGDLHLRQGATKDALDAYRRALNELPPEASDKNDKNTRSQLREVHQKLAQVYLSMGDVEAARNEFNGLDGLQKGQAPQRENSARSAEVKLPGKLVISVPKGLLDQAGASKISFEEFKKAAFVEELNYSKPNATN